jgi:hypothetical protein
MDAQEQMQKRQEMQEMNEVSRVLERTTQMDEVSRALSKNAREVRFGSVSVEIHIHDGRIVKTLYSITKTKLGCSPAEGNAAETA